MDNDDQEWFYKSPEWESLVKTFDEWNSRVECYRCRGEEYEPFVSPPSEFAEFIGFDEETGELVTSEKTDRFVYPETIAKRLASLLHTVAKIDPMPVLDAYLAVETYERASHRGDKPLPPEPWLALRRAEMLYDLVWAESRTNERPSPTATAFTGESERARRHAQAAKDQEATGNHGGIAVLFKGMTKKAIAEVRMILEIHKNNDAEGWSINAWNRALPGIGRTTISETKVYRGLMLLREKNRAERAQDKHQKKRPVRKD